MDLAEGIAAVAVGRSRQSPFRCSVAVSAAAAKIARMDLFVAVSAPEHLTSGAAGIVDRTQA